MCVADLAGKGTGSRFMIHVRFRFGLAGHVRGLESRPHSLEVPVGDDRRLICARRLFGPWQGMSER